MSSNFINSRNTDKKEAQQTQGTEKTIYIGVFFDGTGNNKFQVMLGKMYRGKEALANFKDKNGTALTIGDARKMGRSTLKSKGLTESQLDEIFFGYGDKNTYFVEDSIHPVDLVGQPEDIKDTIIQNVEYNMDLYKQAKKEYESDANHPGNSEKEWKNLKSKLGEGGDIQGSTYTNVAILESLYKSDDDVYFPIYVEGAGTNLSMGWRSGMLELIGAGTGTGPTGVWAKVEKAAFAITRLCQKYIYEMSVSKLTIHVSVFGFSRGATEARMFAHLFNPDKKQIRDALCEISRTEFLSESNIEKQLDFVGIFDTVSSQGGNFDNDVNDLFLYGVNNSKYTLHLCAMDEYRSNFALTDIQSVGDNGLEIFMPGCHTDVGGGISLGIDDWREISRTPENELLKPEYKHLCINKWGRKGDSEYYEISLSTLIDMGWLSEDSIKVTQDTKYTKAMIESDGAAYMLFKDSIRMKRYTKPGYSNIPLNMMHQKSLDKGLPFSAIPCSYLVTDQLLSDLMNKWKPQLSKKGQVFVNVSNSEYRSLRRYFLHFSSDDSLTGKAVNSATYMPLKGSSYQRTLMTRKIHQGFKNGGHYYLYSISDNPASPEKKQVYMTAAK